MFKIKRLQKSLEHQEKGSDVVTAIVFFVIITVTLVIYWLDYSSLKPIEKLRPFQVASAEICSPLNSEPILGETEGEGELVLASDGSYIQKTYINTNNFDSYTYSRHCGFNNFDENRNNAYTFTYTTARGDIETVTVPENFVKFKQSSSEPPTVTVKKLEKLEGEGLYEISIPLEEYTKIMNNK